MKGRQYFSNAMLNSMSDEEIKHVQEKSLRDQLKYCYKRSDFYRRRFVDAGAQPEDIKTLEELRSLPIFMDKEQERMNGIESLDRDGHPFGTHLCAPQSDIYLTGTTSGTTGTPTFTYTFTKADVDTIAVALGHRFAYNGVQKGDRVLFIFALGIYATTMTLWGLRGIGAVPIDIDARAGSELMLRFGELTRPQYMATTVSLAEHLIQKAPGILRKDVGELGLKGVFLTGEVGVSIPEVKERIEDAYGCPAYDYWAPAGHAVGVTCKATDYWGMHGVAPDLCTSYEDLVDPETKKPVQVEDGAIGEMIITSLRREAAPLVRYVSGDIVQIYTKECPHCGFPGKRMKVLGRADDMLVVKGVNIYPAAIKQVVQSFKPRVTGEMRIVLMAPPPRVIPPLILKLERSVATRDPELADLSKEIAQRMHDKLKIRPAIEWVDPESLEKSTRKTPIFEKQYEQKEA